MMSVHALIQFLKYKWKAKGLHGIHSPFVYALRDRCLKNKPGNLHDKLIQYFGTENFQFLSDEEWLSQNAISANKTRIVALKDIHKTAPHTHQWEKLAAADNINLSIDLYEMGLLVFNDDLKEKQHFILKNK